MKKNQRIDRLRVLRRYGGKCGYCGEEINISTMQVDHIIPQSGFENYVRNKVNVPYFLLHLKDCDKNHLMNLMPSCRVCNKWKNSFHLELFRYELSQQLIRLNKSVSGYRMAKKYNMIKEVEKPVVFYFETFLL